MVPKEPSEKMVIKTKMSLLLFVKLQLKMIDSALCL
jgi:hypothetical protein